VNRRFDANGKASFSLGEQARGWDDHLALAEYSETWAAHFLIEARVLSELLRPLHPRIEHIGSTAVPGMLARPIVDMAIMVEQPRRLALFADRLASCGYLCDPFSDHAQFTWSRRDRGIRTYVLMVHGTESPQARQQLWLRDRLRGDEQLAAHFAEIKRSVTRRFPYPRAAYRDAKADFFSSLMPAPTT
jgi:GrpB-like predicted nucleotidyltransferase (UPF0157 family)